MNKLLKKIKKYYSLDYKKSLLPKILSSYFLILSKKYKKINDSVLGIQNLEGYNKLIEKYSSLNKDNSFSLSFQKELVDDMFTGIPRWKSPNFQNNVGAPVNSISSAIYALSLDENIFALDNRLASNSIIAESAVSEILSNLAGLKSNGIGFFTFGGTATNLYAQKVGLKKSLPDSGKRGIRSEVKNLITKEAHFAHISNADWLGIGTDNVIIMDSNIDGRTNLKSFSKNMEELLSNKKKVSTIILNCGTTYDHTVDDLKKIVDLRNKFVKKYSLDYIPHIHADSVIGWAWLFFKDYDFKKNNLKFSLESLNLIKKQYGRVSQLKYVDSWGVDFHKGIGGCPVPCSIVMFNNPQDIKYISKIKDPKVKLHQLSREFSYTSPVDYTLETSRSAGASLAALSILHFLGVEGFQIKLGNLIEMRTLIQRMLKNIKGIEMINSFSLGFANMIRIYPPELWDHKLYANDLLNVLNSQKFVSYVNNYMKEFFLWDYDTRISKNKGVNYSFTSRYKEYGRGVEFSVMKFYPVSVHLNKKNIENEINELMKQKEFFDKKIWKANWK